MNASLKKKLWLTVFLSSLVIPIFGGIIAAMFIMFAASHVKKHAKSNIIIATVYTVIVLSILLILPTYSNNRFVSVIGPMAFLVIILLALKAIVTLQKNIRILANHKTSVLQNADPVGDKYYSHIVDANQNLNASDILQGEVRNQEQLVCDVLIIKNVESLRTVLRHIRTIVTKYEQALYRDDYGNLELDKATKEIDYFISKTIRNAISSVPLPPHISGQDYISLLSIILNGEDHDHDEIREVIENFLKISDEDDFDDVISGIAISLMVWLTGKEYRNETLQFIYGDNYQSLRAMSSSVINHRFDNADQSQYAQDSVMNCLITPSDLLNLKKWFCGRQGHKINLDDIVTGQEFELFCQKRFQELGWNAKTTQVTGDFGADLVVEKDGVIIIIQCKYYSQPIGVKAVQEAFSAMTFYNAHKAAVVTNQTFTKAARQMAEKNNVALLHVNELDKL